MRSLGCVASILCYLLVLILVQIIKAGNLEKLNQFLGGDREIENINRLFGGEAVRSVACVLILIEMLNMLAHNYVIFLASAHCFNIQQ